MGSHKNNHGAFSNKKVIAGEHRKGIMKQEVFLIAGIDSKVPAKPLREMGNLDIMGFPVYVNGEKNNVVSGSIRVIAGKENSGYPDSA